ncbi:MAG: FtsX-like permease family protein [Dehalococcoidia bacterium]|nr:FtsX-like permease family protein [Dehalococcoidia bacterium]
MLLFRRRLRADITQMVALAVGVLVMTAILAGAPMYLNTIESLGLRSTLTSLSSAHRNLQVVVDGLPLTDRAVSTATGRVDVALAELGDLVVSVGQESRTRDHLWAVDADSIVGGPTADVAVVQRFEGFLDNATIVAGRPPGETVKHGDGFVIVEAAVPAARARQLGVNVGEGVWLTPSPGDLPYLWVDVVGFFEPKSLEDEFWLGLAEEVTEPGRPGPAARLRLPLFLAGNSLFQAVTGGPASIGTNRWLVQLDLDRLERQSPAKTADQVDAVGHELRRGLPESRSVSALENRLEALDKKISFARIPTLMMGGVLLLAAGYYSIMAAGALMARRRVDTGRLWVRGSARRQIALLFLLEAALLVLVPAALAPFLSAGVITAMGQLPEYESISLGSGMPVYITWQAFAWSFAGAALVLAYMQWSVWKDNGRELGSEQLSTRRVESKPFFQRQYLDLLFFLFGGVVLWDLSTESSVVSETGDRVVDVNPLLVFAPAIFLAVAVLLSLRVLPPVARLVSSGFARRGPVWIHLTSSLFARVPITYAWPTAILGMAVGTAMLSATVAATLQQSATDQSGYQAGADLRISPVDLNSGPRTEVLGEVRAIDGVGGMSAGLRTTGDIRLGGQGVPFQFLAIEPQEFSEIGAFRADYAAGPLATLLLELEEGPELKPLVVPANAERVGVRMRSDTIENNIRMSLRLLDATGLSHAVDLGAVNNLGWHVRMGRIPAVAARPVEVAGLIFFELTPDELGTSAGVQIDDLMYEPGGEGGASGAGAVAPVVLESFDDTDVWQALASSEGMDTSVSGFEYGRTVDLADRTDRGLQVELGTGTDLGVRGVVRANSPFVPALFSETALESNNLAVGDETVVHVFNRSVPARIVGVTDYFPTMDPADGGFVVADLSRLWSHLALSSANSAGVAAEIFVGLDNLADTLVVEELSSEIGGLLSIVSRDELRESSVVTPLAVAGWRGASVVTASLAIALALLGFLTFTPMRPTSDRFNLAVLRALGAGRRGLVVVNVIEQLVVLVVGVAAGVGTGLVMARLAVDTASQTESKVNTLPPIVFSTNWDYVSGLVISLAVIALGVMIFDVITVRRIDIAATTRTVGKSG